MKKKILLINLIIVLLFSLTVNAAEYGGTLRIRSLQQVISLNPTQAVEDISIEITNQIFENLLNIDQNGKLKPLLAKSWEIKDGGRKFSFNLKENVYFQEKIKEDEKTKNRGREVTAEDWKWSLNFLASPKNKSPYTELLKDVKGYQEFKSGEADELSGIRTEGKYRLIIELQRANIPFLYNLTHHAAVVMPREDVINSNLHWSLNPVGSGAFIFENIDSESLVLRKNNNYWQRNDEDKPLPYLDKIKFYFPNTNKNSLNHFSLYKLTSEEYSKFLANSFTDKNYRFKKVAKNYLNYYGIVFNIGNDELLDKRRFREFLNYALDRQKIIENLALNNFIPVRDFFAASNKKIYSYNPKRAEEIIKDFDLNSNFRIKLAVNENSVNQKIAEEIKAQLIDYGIEIEIEKRNWVKHLNFKDNSLFREEYLLAKSSNINVPYNFIYKNFHSDNLSSDNYYNLFNNSRLDNFLEYIKIESDKENRERALSLIKDIIYSEIPVLYLFQSAESYLVDKRIRNFDLLDNYYRVPEYKRLYFEE